MDIQTTKEFRYIKFETVEGNNEPYLNSKTI